MSRLGLTTTVLAQFHPTCIILGICSSSLLEDVKVSVTSVEKVKPSQERVRLCSPSKTILVNGISSDCPTAFTSLSVLISPQHWAQVANDHSPTPNGTCYIGGSESVVLYWRQRKYKRTVRLDPRTNTPIFYSKAGSRIYQAFDAEFVACDAYHKPIETTLLLPPELLRQREAEGTIYGDEELIHTDTTDLDSSAPAKEVRFQDVGNKPLRQSAVTFDPASDGSKATDYQYFSGPTSDEPQAKDSSAELLHWHYRLGHMAITPFRLLIIS